MIASPPAVSAEWRTLLAMIPGYDCFAQAEDCWFDEGAAVKATEFFPKFCKHVEGSLAGKPFVLEPWQRAFVGCLFGWMRVDDAGRTVRRYRECLLYVPRKSGKTPLSAGICNYMLFCDGEAGAQIFGAAADSEQAALLYRQAVGMIDQCELMRSACTVYRGSNHRSVQLKADPGSVYRVVSSDASTKHGGNPHLVLVDELHAQKTRELYDTLTTSMASANRAQSLLLSITTADYARESICNEVYRHACHVRDNKGDRSQPGYDPAFLPVIYELLATEDWTKEENWAKANPNLGISVSMDYMRKECRKAQETPAYQSTFRRLHLNTITESATAWLDLNTWDLGAEPFDEMKLEGRTCWGGLDLSTKLDLSAFVLVFPPTEDMYEGHSDPYWRFLWRMYCPADNIQRRVQRDQVPYDVWARNGDITATPGNVIDYGYIKAQVLKDSQRFDVKSVGYDGWNAMQIALQLQDEGVQMVEVRQGFGSLSEPTKQLEVIVKSEKIRHGGNPCVRWMIGNAMTDIDPAGNVKLSKKRSSDRIDGPAAAVNAMARAMREMDQNVAPTITVLDNQADPFNEDSEGWDDA